MAERLQRANTSSENQTLGGIHADLKIHQFLQAAIREGAHKKVYFATDQLTARARNIAGIYFGSQFDKSDIGRVYGFSDFHPSERTRQIINLFINRLHESASAKLRRKFPLPELCVSKPETERSFDKRSAALGGRRREIRQLVRFGMNNPDAIAQFLSKPVDRVRAALYELRRTGQIPESKVVKNIRLLEKVNAATKPADFRGVLSEVDYNFYQGHRGYFVAISIIAREAGFRCSGHQLLRFLNILDAKSLPYAPIKRSPKSDKARGQYSAVYLVLHQQEFDVRDIFLHARALRDLKVATN